ncbi:MAG: hypothetical protein QG608_32, partial [Actinomycetota bacterium]|nr:hypothetical protein [Actinomycetota bacterium]
MSTENHPEGDGISLFHGDRLPYGDGLPPGDGPVVLAEADGPDGRTVLRRRGGTLELIVNGVFAMDSE